MVTNGRGSLYEKEVMREVEEVVHPADGRTRLEVFYGIFMKEAEGAGETFLKTARCYPPIQKKQNVRP